MKEQWKVITGLEVSVQRKLNELSEKYRIKVESMLYTKDLGGLVLLLRLKKKGENNNE